MPIEEKPPGSKVGDRYQSAIPNFQEEKVRPEEQYGAPVLSSSLRIQPSMRFNSIAFAEGISEFQKMIPALSNKLTRTKRRASAKRKAVYEMYETGYDSTDSGRFDSDDEEGDDGDSVGSGSSGRRRSRNNERRVTSSSPSPSSSSTTSLHLHQRSRVPPVTPPRPMLDGKGGGANPSVSQTRRPSLSPVRNRASSSQEYMRTWLATPPRNGKQRLSSTQSKSSSGKKRKKEKLTIDKEMERLLGAPVPPPTYSPTSSPSSAASSPLKRFPSLSPSSASSSSRKGKHDWGVTGGKLSIPDVRSLREVAKDTTSFWVSYFRTTRLPKAYTSTSVRPYLPPGTLTWTTVGRKSTAVTRRAMTFLSSPSRNVPKIVLKFWKRKGTKIEQSPPSRILKLVDRIAKSFDMGILRVMHCLKVSPQEISSFLHTGNFSSESQMEKTLQTLIKHLCSYQSKDCGELCLYLTIVNPRVKAEFDSLNTGYSFTHAALELEWTPISRSNFEEEIEVMEYTDVDDGNESICNECKKPGILVCCESCPRAFHFGCVDEDVDVLEEMENYICKYCKESEEEEDEEEEEMGAKEKKTLKARTKHVDDEDDEEGEEDDEGEDEEEDDDEEEEEEEEGENEANKDEEAKEEEDEGRVDQDSADNICVFCRESSPDLLCSSCGDRLHRQCLTDEYEVGSKNSQGDIEFICPECTSITHSPSSVIE